MTSGVGRYEFAMNGEKQDCYRAGMDVYEMEEKESLDTNGIIGDIKRDEHTDKHSSFQLSPENYDHRNLYNDANDNHVMPCTGHKTESYTDHWYPEIDDDSCTNVNGAEQCIYDFTEVASNGGLEIARDRCMDNGGILYTFDGAITCPDGSSYTFVNDVLECFFGCDARSAEYTTKVDLTADVFLTSMGLKKRLFVGEYDCFRHGRGA